MRFFGLCREKDAGQVIAPYLFAFLFVTTTALGVILIIVPLKNGMKKIL